jgi:hypothetical protein
MPLAYRQESFLYLVSDPNPMHSVDETASEACIITGVRPLRQDGGIDSDMLGDIVLQYDRASGKVGFLSIGLTWKPFQKDYAVSHFVAGTIEPTSFNVNNKPDCVSDMMKNYVDNYYLLKCWTNERLSPELRYAKDRVISSLK